MSCYECKGNELEFVGRDQNGVEIWRCQRCGHNQKAVLCPHCQIFTVTLAALTAHQVEVWHCSTCGESKHWCPRCNQGWILPKGAAYVCDECDSEWPDKGTIGNDTRD